LIETNTHVAIRTSRYIYAEHYAGTDEGAKELYDLENDPYELESRHGDRLRRHEGLTRAASTSPEAVLWGELPLDDRHHSEVFRGEEFWRKPRAK